MKVQYGLYTRSLTMSWDYMSRAFQTYLALFLHWIIYSNCKTTQGLSENAAEEKNGTSQSKGLLNRQLFNSPWKSRKRMAASPLGEWDHLLPPHSTPFLWKKYVFTTSIAMVKKYAVTNLNHNLQTSWLLLREKENNILPHMHHIFNNH